MILVLVGSVACLAALSATFVAVLVLRRLRLARREAAQGAAAERLLPTALALLSGDIAIADLPVGGTEVLGRLLLRFSRQLAGEGRLEIASFFEESGGVDRELAALAHRRPWRRATAAFALGDMASKRAVPPLLKALQDRNRSVRAAAARSVGLLAAPGGVEPLLRALVRRDIPYGVAGHALLAIGQGALPGLRHLTGDPDAEIRSNAIELIGLLGDASDGPELVEHLRDPSAEARAKAARALGRLGAADATEQLCSTLGDRIPFVRVAVANALGAVGDAAVAGPLLGVACSSSFAAARAAASALARVDPQMLAAADDAGPHLREASDLLAIHGGAA